MEDPQLSVVIVNYNSVAYTRRCLASLAAGAAGLRWEAIIVDNASPRRGVEGLAGEFASVRVIVRRTNGGFAVGANTGIRAARAATILLLNPDTVVRPGAVTTMARYLDQHPDVGVLGPRIENPDGTLQLSCRRFPTLSAALFNRYSLLTRLLPRNRFSASYLMSDWDHTSARAVDWLSGSAMLLPRAALAHVGLFDEGFFFTAEDVDLCRRMWDAGWRVVYLPEATVVHQIGGSSATLPNRVVIERHRGMWRYYRKHLQPSREASAGRWVAAVSGMAVAAGISARCLAQLALVNVARSRRPGRRGPRPGLAQPTRAG